MNLTHKIAHYQTIICTLLTEYAAIKKSLIPSVKAQLLLDRVHQHYQSLSVGWHNGQSMCVVSFHFDLIDGKIWIQQNNIDALIADELVERGVAKEDIVLGFVPENVRVHSGYATA